LAILQGRPADYVSRFDGDPSPFAFRPMLMDVPFLVKRQEGAQNCKLQAEKTPRKCFLVYRSGIRNLRMSLKTQDIILIYGSS
jgi:hypothetical protein